MLTVDFDRWAFRAGERVLDLGCGGGRHAVEAMRRGARVVALDLDLQVVRSVNRTGIGQVAADALHLPFADGSFDRVIASEVLEHIENDLQAIAEIERVLRPSGAVAVTVPRWWPERLCWVLSERYHCKPGGHVRIYSSRELMEKFVAAGFDVVGSHHAHALHSPYWWLKCVFGVDNEEARVPRLYHRMLVWDLMHPSSVVRRLERRLDPLLGKSLVVYARKTAEAA